MTLPQETSVSSDYLNLTSQEYGNQAMQKPNNSGSVRCIAALVLLIWTSTPSPFRDSFTKKLEKMGIQHTFTSPFNSQSNGGAERTVHSLKQVLRKREIKRTDDITLQSQSTFTRQAGIRSREISGKKTQILDAWLHRKDHQPIGTRHGKVGTADGAVHQ